MDARRESSLLLESRGCLALSSEVGIEELDRDIAVEHAVATAVDDASRAASEHLAQLVAPSEYFVAGLVRVDERRHVERLGAFQLRRNSRLFARVERGDGIGVRFGDRTSRPR